MSGREIITALLDMGDLDKEVSIYTEINGEQYDIKTLSLAPYLTYRKDDRWQIIAAPLDIDENGAQL